MNWWSNAKVVLTRWFNESVLYSHDEKRVVKYLLKVSNNEVGAGKDPIGFLMASHAAIRDDNVELRHENTRLKFLVEFGCSECIVKG